MKAGKAIESAMSTGLDSVTLWIIGILVGILVLYYIRKTIKDAWTLAEPIIFTKQALIIFAVWFVLLVGTGGTFAGGWVLVRMAVFGVPR